MLASQRKQHILDVLKRDGRIVAKEFSDELGLSEDTIRRDLRELAQDGLLQRVHGGALPVSPAIANFARREEILVESKVAIGRAAAGMIRDGQTAILDGGTTAIQIARALHPNLIATIITHSPRTAVELVDHPNVEVILIGGKLYKHSVVSIGAAALEAISHIRADIFFMGVTGVHPEAGLSTGDYEEAHIKLALSRRAAETFVLASSEKLGAASQYVIAPISEVSGLIIEAATPGDLVMPYIQAGLSLVRAQ